MTGDGLRVTHLAGAAALFAALLFFTMPASPWEFDEVLFFHALDRYDPLAHHPPPPGYPVFIGAGKLVRMIASSDFSALRAISIAASLIGFVMLALAFRNIASAVLFYVSPAMVVHASLPISDPGALALLASALYFAPSSAGWFAAFAALAVGWRIQFAIFVVPLFLTRVVMMRQWRDRWIAMAVFTAVCLAWLVPLAMAVGGFEELVKFETGQGQYLVSHDADQSRGGWSAPMIALRFIAHPWGVKLMSVPVLVLACIGLFVRARAGSPAPHLLVAGAIYIACALAVMDPADGVRYALPFVLVTAFFAGEGLRRVPLPPWILPAIFCAASLAYTSSLLYQRSTLPSPPLQAVEHARRTFGPNAVAAYELPLWPHATYFLGDYAPARLNDAMTQYFDRPDVELFLFADGAAREPGAATFAWAPSDAYSKLTRNHYRVASIIPIPPQRRYRALSGVYGPEREPDGLAWRWLAPVSRIQLPSGGARTAIVQLGLPADSAIASNEVTIETGGGETLMHRVGHGVSTIEIPIAGGSPVLTFRGAQSFIPADVPGSLSRDRRPLSVKLLGLETRPASELAAPEDALPR